jgi:hypothetical protein
VFHTDLEGAYSEVAITFDDPPTFTFVRSPFNFTRPLPRTELRELAAGRFGPDLDAQLRACTLPPTPPLSDDDRARIVRLAGDAWAAAETTAQTGGAGVLGGEQSSSMPNALPPATHPPSPIAPASLASTPPSAAVAPAPRRALKVLLTLRPDGPAGYRALVSVGAAGCDPHFATIEATGTLAAVLNAVPAIVAAAETRWCQAPRYPTTLRRTVTATAAPAKEAARLRAGVTRTADGAGAGTDPALTGAADLTTTDSPPAKPAATTQISLFG